MLTSAEGNHTGRTPLAIGLALLLIAAGLVGMLGHRALFDPDEGRYAEIAREMWLSGDWITPRLNGIKYFEKPPLQYWATALAFKLFGVHPWTARLWPGLCTLGTLASVFVGARRLGGAQAGLIAVLTLGSSLLFVAFSQIVSLDIGVTCFLTLALVAYLAAGDGRLSARAQWGWALTLWAAMALALLSKGLIGVVLPALTLLVCALAERRWPRWQSLHWASGLAVFTAIAAPWLVLVQLHNPEFARFFFIHEHFARFASGQHQRPGPWYFFVAILLLGCIPWSLAFARSWLEAMRCRADHAGLTSPINSPRVLALWCLVILAFFSLSSSKLPAYVLPVLPGLAMLAGWSACRLNARTLAPPWRMIVMAGIGLMAALPLIERQAGLAPGTGSAGGLSPWMMAAGLLLVAAGLAARWLVRQPMSKLATCAAGALLAAQLLQWGVSTMTSQFNCASLLREAQQLQGPFAPEATFYSVGMYDQTLPLELGRLVRLVAYSDEFAFGLQQEPQRALETLDAFEQEWRPSSKAYAMMPPDVLQLLQARDLPVVVLARNATSVLVARR